MKLEWPDLLNKSSFRFLIFSGRRLLVCQLGRDVVNEDLDLLAEDSVEDNLSIGQVVVTLARLRDLRDDVLYDVV